MPNAQFIQDFSLLMLVSGLVTVIFQHLRQPALLGFIVAGMLIGPHGLIGGWVREKETIHAVGDLGVIFLMFTLGLHFSFRKLHSVGLSATITGLVEAPIAFIAFFFVGRILDWTVIESVFLASALCISSTILIFKTLSDQGKSQASFTGVLFGITIVEDLLAIALLAMLPGIALQGTFDFGFLISILFKLGIFFITIVIFGLIFAPRFVDTLNRMERPDVLLTAVLGLCFGVALLAMKLGYSVALGAFITGAVVAESKAAERIGFMTKPISDLFSGLFFVAMGMLIEPKQLWHHADTALLIGLALYAVKIIATTVGALIAGESLPQAMRIGVSLAQIGEFSFVIAGMGMALGVGNGRLYPVVIAVSFLTMVVSPYLLRHSDVWIDQCVACVPRFVSRGIELYHLWLERIKGSGNIEKQVIVKLMQKIIIQLVLNVSLITGIILFAAYAARTWNLSEWLEPWLGKATWVDDWQRTLFWGASMLLCLPLIVATYRKHQALSMLISEMTLQRVPSKMSVEKVRAFVTQAAVITGMLLLFLWIVAVSSTLLPPWRLLIGLLIGLSIVIAIFRQRLILVYTRAQLAIVETLDAPLEKTKKPETRELPPMLRGADLKVYKISESAWACGRFLKDLELRPRTGTNIVGIERAEKSLVNPGPNEILLPGDLVLLLGTRNQLSKGTDYLDDGPLRK